ncbi:MAG: hypothetical protein A3B34_00550 [Candidatus Sungbacteria bacterium RIFCSPLOWO2_01_FULL_54_21]|uniref:Cation-transporting P-type ATPase N-terminal domain-containing protein n=2 Tax=Candidatus Sungiibacteriota TaxID=1817917 RepID=A0A1G2LA50_9BACT|nr:MAG: hypothetical protein A2679_03025 [Candidatus Sungbacteria bacterium RIFCSPHIGHO2_01_FULL_54_26]OHA03098.1 MAG: hypothetical protein A3C92_02040 [Candidatus Sungbacteria bacterium RIFCSPHIGHO2_02_FULL_53_17]OHA07712.1 MAG: hypothetical protein A3B34_00550 [Candidatus Sungbacteria bacterium RIFCSPLOWO2_01_FULL_54_21]
MDPTTTKEPFWAMSSDEALRLLAATPEGLTRDEVRKRRSMFGANAIPEKDGVRAPALLLRQISSPLILVLIAAGCATTVLGEWVETGVIFAAVIVNTALGFYQEYKAESALARLHAYIHIRARVRRYHGEEEVLAEDVVPGDIIRVRQGDQVPADARVIFAQSLEADEAVLTGESLPAEKHSEALSVETGVAERTSMLYRGTLITEGVGDAVVTATGADTEFGRITGLIGSAERAPTPLERAIARFASRTGLALVGLVTMLFVLGVWFGYGILETFLIAIAVAVSAVPEGLPIALTVILAVGVERLAKRKAVVRRLLAAETLGSTTLILTDKTGTLTSARMELAAVAPFAGAEGERELLEAAIANTDVIIENPNDATAQWKMFGRPIEVALVRGAAIRGVSVADRPLPVDQMPFNSVRKFSVTIHPHGNGFRTVVFGAPDVLAAFTDMNEADHAAVKKEWEIRAAGGERVLGAACKDTARHHVIHAKDALTGFRFLGLLSFRDPLRPGVAEAIRRIGEAGVRTIMVTGDHRGTAESVAHALGLAQEGSSVLTGDDMRYLKPEEWHARSHEASVYARVTPEQKSEIVAWYQSQGEVVALTGDGVNDAPALARADIGIALGSGSEVAKSAADLVLLDDSFETIVAAIEEGRKILDNIRKVIVYLLSDTLDELLLIGGALIMGLPLPLSALQILFVNFFSDSFPALALAFEQGVDGLGKRPRTLDRNLFDRTMRVMIVVIGFSTSALLFLFYYTLLRWGFDPALVRTFIFASFATYTLFLSFSVRSLERSIFTYDPFSNRFLVVGAGIGIVLTAWAVYVPFAQHIFGTVPLPLPWVFGVVGVGLLNILAVEAGKWLLQAPPSKRHV